MSKSLKKLVEESREKNQPEVDMSDRGVSNMLDVNGLCECLARACLFWGGSSGGCWLRSTPPELLSVPLCQERKFQSSSCSHWEASPGIRVLSSSFVLFCSVGLDVAPRFLNSHFSLLEIVFETLLLSFNLVFVHEQRACRSFLMRKNSGAWRVLFILYISSWGFILPIQSWRCSLLALL